MVSYSAISDTELQVNKPITSSLQTRMRDNPISIFEAMGWPVTASVYISPQQTVVGGTTFTVAHGLTSFSPTNGVPTIYMVCLTNDINYTAGDVVLFNPAGDTSASNNGLSVIVSATQIVVRIGSAGLILVRPNDGIATNITAASWAMVVNLRG